MALNGGCAVDRRTLSECSNKLLHVSADERRGHLSGRIPWRTTDALLRHEGSGPKSDSENQPRANAHAESRWTKGMGRIS